MEVDQRRGREGVESGGDLRTWEARGCKELEERAGSSAGRGGGDKAESKERECLLKSRAEGRHLWPRDLFESQV